MRRLTEDDKLSIQEAIELVEEAQRLVDQAVSGTPFESHYDAYGKYGFSELLGNRSPYDSSLFDLMDPEDEDDYLYDDEEE